MHCKFFNRDFKNNILTQNIPFKDKRNGQILLLFAFFFLIILGLFVVSLNIGELAKERIIIQQAADAGAIAAAQSLASGAEAVVVINNKLAKDLQDMYNDIMEVLWIPIIGAIIAIAEAVSDGNQMGEGMYLRGL